MNLLTGEVTPSMRHPEPEPAQRRFGTVRWIAALMIFESTTLFVASALHLSGLVHGRSEPFNAIHAGAAEAVIGAVLGGAAIAVFGEEERGRTIEFVATAFALVGFLVGLRFTTLGGHAPDVAYHLILLPVFITTMVVLIRLTRSRSRWVET